MNQSADVEEAMGLNEEEKIQAAADIADAIYSLHGHSKVLIHSADHNHGQ